MYVYSTRETGEKVNNKIMFDEGKWNLAKREPAQSTALEEWQWNRDQK